LKLAEISNQWKCVVALFVGAATLCGLAVGFDHRYLLAAQGEQMQQQIYHMQVQSNYNNFLMRLDSLRAAYEGKPIPKPVQDQIRWLEAQIQLLEKEMGLTDGD
jgi:hypothetical protein